ncbi:MAG TPA: copper amine oxidase N-terminal domain-containing protein [Epulopiscium sp.]|nr:copper amine oxidase N-terminal domain-containing protein [Candidatus Epulonipiscium sp.]
MGKKVMMLLLVTCMTLAPVQIFGATDNYIPYIATGKVDQFILGEITIDNTDYDFQAGQFFRLSLVNAEFDLDYRDAVRIGSSSIEFEDGYKNEVVGMVKEDVIEGSVINISFYTKLLGGPAEIVIDSMDSGITSGTYTYAISGEIPASYKGQVQNIESVLLEKEAIIKPIVIKEPKEASFRTSQMSKADKEDLIKLTLADSQFEFRNATPRDWVKFIVDDGQGNVIRYREGEDEEVQFNQKDNVITFNEKDDKIFELEGKNYTITIENLKIRAIDTNEPKRDVEVQVSGALVADQKIIVAHQDVREKPKPEPEPEEVEEPETPEPTEPEEPEVIIPPVIPQEPEQMLAKVEFTVGKEDYKVDGLSHPIDAKPYISVHDRIMVPVRYVAYALGAQEKDVRWDGQAGTITINGDKPMIIDMGKKEMIRGSIINTLSEITVIEGRTFVPVGEIGKAFGSKVTWDGESRTATFN